MFEVGKKYLIGKHGSDIYKCIAIHERKGWLVLNGKPLTYDWTDNCKEYKEPRTITRWVNVYEDVKNTYLSFGNMWEDKDCAIRHGKGCDKTFMVYVDTIPISYTEPH